MEYLLARCESLKLRAKPHKFHLFLIFKSTAYRLRTSKIDSSVCLMSDVCLMSVVSDSSLNLRSERFGRQISLECSGMI